MVAIPSAHGRKKTNFFIGYQVAGMTLSTFFFMGAGVALVMALTLVVIVVATTSSGDQLLRDATSALPQLGWLAGGITMTVVFQLVVNRCIFFTGPIGSQWLRFRFWYALYEYPRRGPNPRLAHSQSLV
jgi:hypothetical protein